MKHIYKHRHFHWYTLAGSLLGLCAAIIFTNVRANESIAPVSFEESAIEESSVPTVAEVPVDFDAVIASASAASLDLDTVASGTGDLINDPVGTDEAHEPAPPPIPSDRMPVPSPSQDATELIGSGEVAVAATATVPTVIEEPAPKPEMDQGEFEFTTIEDCLLPEARTYFMNPGECMRQFR